MPFGEFVGGEAEQDLGRARSELDADRVRRWCDVLHVERSAWAAEDGMAEGRRDVIPKRNQRVVAQMEDEVDVAARQDMLARARSRPTD